MKLFSIVIFMVLSLSLLAQNFQPFDYKVPGEIPVRYERDPFELYARILASLEEEDVRDLHKERFAEMVAFGVNKDFERGIVYMGWDRIENYLNNVLDELNQHTEDDLSQMYVYFIRSPQVNAYTVADGTIYITAGLLASLENEASLASILGHEVSHYLEQDSKNEFFNNLKAYTRRNRNKSELNIRLAHDNQTHEKRCDKYGWNLAYDAGYDASAFRSILITFSLRREEAEKWNRGLSNVGSEKQNGLAKLLASHPETEERLDSLKQFMDWVQDNNKETKAVIVSESDFRYAKYQSSLEVLEMYRDRNAINGYFSNAFVQAQLNPDDPVFTEHLVEALRRKLYFERDLMDEKVLNNFFPFQPDIDSWDDLMANLMKTDDKFSQGMKGPLVKHFASVPTYGELVIYLEQEIKSRGIKEGYLSLALIYYGFDKEKFTRYLEAYLQMDDAKHLAYGEALINGKLGEKTGSLEYFVLDEVTILEDHYYGMHNRLMEARKLNLRLDKLYKEKFSKRLSDNTELVALAKLASEDPEEYYDLHALTGSAVFYLDLFEESKGYETSDEIVFDDALKSEGEEEDEVKDKFDLFLFTPQVWELYTKYNIASVSFSRATSVDEREALKRTVCMVCNPYSWLYRLTSGSTRYRFTINHLKLDIAQQEYSAISETFRKKFKAERYLKYLNRLIDEME